jgi:hypothetical protein
VVVAAGVAGFGVGGGWLDLQPVENVQMHAAALTHRVVVIIFRIVFSCCRCLLLLISCFTGR